jgi:hypothetical protein
MIEADPLEGAYLATDLCFFDKLKGNPRYIAMLEKLNLPLTTAN